MTKPVFIFRDRNTFWWPITFMLPQDGGVVEASFEAEFVMTSEDELIGGSLDTTDEDRVVAFARFLESDRERLRKCWVGFRGIVTETGEDVSFSEETRESLLSWRAIRIAVGEAYGEAMFGQLEERSGN